MFAAVDFVNKQQHRPALGDLHVNFPQFMVYGIDRGLLFNFFAFAVQPRIRFYRWQTTDFAFFQQISVNHDQAPVVSFGQFFCQSRLADSGLADD